MVQDLRVDPKRLQSRIEELAASADAGPQGVNRLAFSPADIQGRRLVASWVRQAGLQVRTDPAGNLIGRCPGSRPGLPPILTGSHIDSVPQAGKYDGTAGVIAALECVQLLQDNQVQTRHPLEAVVFSDEEGSMVGSRAMARDVSQEILDLTTQSGKTVAQGLRDVGGDPDRLSEAARRPGQLRACLEMHIEQGGVLESESADIGVVEGIVGIAWWEVAVTGFANHAGTTPMDRRRDALLAASRMVMAVNQVVRGFPGRQVGTVGRIQAEPGAPNVIPGRAVFSLELRDLSMEIIQSMFREIRRRSGRIEESTSTRITFTPLDATALPALTDPQIRGIISDSARQLGLKALEMPSGAGHDAQNIARIAPIGMIFVPSQGGISHSPREYTSPQQLANGTAVLLQTLLKIDSEAGGRERQDPKASREGPPIRRVDRSLRR